MDDRTRKKCSIIASVLALTAGIVYSVFGGVRAEAVGSASDTPVTVTYYTGKPTEPEAYDAAMRHGDSAVGKRTFTTKSTGRLQWGEPNANGEYEVYYDAADIHIMAAYLNETEEAYEALYEKYLEAYKAVMQ